MGRERPGRVVSLRRGRDQPVPEEARPGPDLPVTPGGAGRVRVLLEEAAGDGVLVIVTTAKSSTTRRRS